MDIFDYKQFPKFVEGITFEDSQSYSACVDISQRIHNLVNLENIQVFYPQKFLHGKQDIKIIITTTDGKIQIISFENEKMFVMEQKLENIDTKELVESINGLRDVSLKILFKNGFKITLDSKLDSNIHWHAKYADKIKEIFKLIV